MAPGNDLRRRIFVGTHDGVCAVNTSDGGMTWTRGNITPLANAAARLSVSLVDPDRAYLAAYEAGVYKTNDGGVTWHHTRRITLTASWRTLNSPVFYS